MKTFISFLVGFAIAAALVVPGLRAQNISSGTVTAAVITGGLTASGSAANDFSASTGAFKTSTGANQLSGAATITDATTPSLTMQAGSTNTGFLLINGKTSGGMKFQPADAAAQTVTIQLAAQTVGAATLTIPDQAGTSRNLVTDTGTQTLTNKTFTAPTVSAITAGAQKFLLTGSGSGPLQLAATQTTPPTCSSNCGTTVPAIAGTDTAGIVTMGSGGSPASAWVVSFNAAWAAAPTCIVESALASMVVGKQPIAVVTTVNNFTVTTNGTAPATSDKYQYVCFGVQ